MFRLFCDGLREFTAGYYFFSWGNPPPSLRNCTVTSSTTSVWTVTSEGEGILRARRTLKKRSFAPWLSRFVRLREAWCFVLRAIFSLGSHFGNNLLSNSYQELKHESSVIPPPKTQQR